MGLIILDAMLPVLLDLKFIKIYTYGVFLVLAFFWGSFLLWKNIRLTSYKEEDVFDGLFFALAGGLLLARLTYVVLNFQKFGFDLIKFILINGYPGLSLYGGLFGGLAALWLFFVIKKIKFTEIIDYFISPLFLALVFGKLGSFFSGAEIGSKTKFFLSIKYVGFDSLRHLTPLYEAIFFILGTYLAYRLLFEMRKEKYSHGFIFYFFCWYFALTNFLFDKIKGDHLYFLGQSLNFFVSIILLLTVSLYFLYYFKSLIGERLRLISSSFKYYGKKAYQKIYQRTKGKTRTREDKNSKTN